MRLIITPETGRPFTVELPEGRWTTRGAIQDWVDANLKGNPAWSVGTEVRY